MGCGNFELQSQFPRWCYSAEEINGRQNDQPITIREKVIPHWFYLPISDVCREYREFRKTFVHFNQVIKFH